MATWLDSSVMDVALNDIKNTATASVRVVHSYTAGMTHAQVVTNTVMSESITSGDYTGPQAGTSNARELVFDGKSGTASGTTTTEDLHIVITDDAGTTVLVATDETSDQAITSGNPVTIPEFTITINQPTQV